LNRREFVMMMAGSGLAAAHCTTIDFSEGSTVDDGAPTAARIVVRPGQALNEISPLLFGSAVEWVDHGNGLCNPASGELRQAVIDELLPLRLPVIRFPGGILADHYHWRDGIGPLRTRPVRKNPMDGSDHANTFGTDEYIRLLKALSAEALVTANVGTGTYDELAAWREHFARQGSPVNYWELGNEIYLAEPTSSPTIPGNDARIYKTPRNYATIARDWAKQLRGSSPGLLAGGIAGTANTSRENRGWLQTLVREAGADLDFIALHNAFAPLAPAGYDFADRVRRENAYRAMFAQAMTSADDCADVRRQCVTAAPGRQVRLAITEHFPLFGTGGDDAGMRRLLDQSRTMASAMYTASLFHAWMREGVWMAAYNLTTSKWFGALLTDTDAGLIRTPTYHVFDLLRNRLGTRRVAIDVEGGRFPTDTIGPIAARAAVPYLDSVAAIDATGGLTISVINRRFGAPVTATFDGAAAAPVDVWSLAADDPSAINGPRLSESTRADSLIQPRRSQWTFTPGSTRELPPNSLTLLRWPSA
jgi:alpha-N-arabinofuranosidase